MRVDKDGLNYLQELMQRNTHIQSITTNGYWRNYHDGTWELRRNQNGAVVRIYDKKAQTPGLSK